MQVVIDRTEKGPLLSQGGVLWAGSAPTRTAELRRFGGGERRTGSEATRRTASRTRLRSTCAGRCLPFGGGGGHAHRTPRRTARSCRPCSGSRQPNSTPSRSPCAGRRPVRLPGLRRGCRRRPGSRRGCADCLRDWARPRRQFPGWNPFSPGAAGGKPPAGSVTKMPEPIRPAPAAASSAGISRGPVLWRGHRAMPRAAQEQSTPVRTKLARWSQPSRPHASELTA